MTIEEAIQRGYRQLALAEIAEPRREAASLLAYAIGQDAAFLIAHSDDHLAAPYKMMFDACLRRRAKHEPFQYITGRQEFYRLEFEVTPDVLIPRPETEILVEKAVEILNAFPDPRFCEVGVGSGCISVSILHEVETATAVSTDVSRAALAVARSNADKHRVIDRLTLVEADVFDGANGRFEMIVSNPPYVPTEQLDSLQAEVRDFEPRTALAGGPNGLSVIERIIAQAPLYLKAGGLLLMEVGFDQSERVASLFDNAVWNEPEFTEDLQGIPRILSISLQ
jgi:release factor glutamine methyltransferase